MWFTPPIFYNYCFESGKSYLCSLLHCGRPRWLHWMRDAEDFHWNKQEICAQHVRPGPAGSTCICSSWDQHNEELWFFPLKLDVFQLGGQSVCACACRVRLNWWSMGVEKRGQDWSGHCKGQQGTAFSPDSPPPIPLHELVPKPWALEQENRYNYWSNWDFKEWFGIWHPISQRNHVPMWTLRAQSA